MIYFVEEKFVDAKRVIGSRKSKMDRQKKKDKT